MRVILVDPPPGAAAPDYNPSIVVPALILAAGESSRMGRAKALLPSRDPRVSFLEQLAGALRVGGAADVLVVGRPEDTALEEKAASMEPPVRFVPNPHAHLGQLSSLVAGLNVADRPGARAVLVAPVDTPLVSADTVAAILAAFDATLAPVVRPVHGGRHGHPVLFARAVFDDLRHADPSHGARAVVAAHGSRVVNVEVDDPGVLEDIDTPDDYQRTFGRPPT
jgi:molybdenum cofactor cytidylyltransferase